MNWRECPDCRTPQRPKDEWCSGCGLLLTGPLAEELWQVQAAITDLESQLRALAARKGELTQTHLQMVCHLRSMAPPEPAAVTEAPAPEQLPSRVAAQPAAVPARERPRRDLSRYAVQNLLLLLGGLLLGIAAVVFTVVSWGHLSTRAAVLVAGTAGALAFPWALARRRMQATAETFAYIGLVLVPLSGLAIVNAVLGRASDTSEVSAQDGAGLWPLVAASALLAAGWAGYARIAPLRLPGPTALVLAQIPLPLAAYAAGPTPAGCALALLLTALFDLVVWRTASRGGAVASTAGAAGVVFGFGGAATAVVASSLADAPGAASRVSGVLVLAAVVAAAYAWFTTEGVARVIASGVVGTAIATALAAPVRVLLPGHWAVAVHAASACLVLAATAWQPRRARPLARRLRAGATGAAGVVLVLSVVWVSPYVVVAAAEPFTWFGSPWSGTRPLAGPPAPPLVMALAALAAVWWSRAGAIVLAAMAVLAFPVAAGWPIEAEVAVLVSAVAAALWLAAAARPVPVVAAAAGAGAYVAVVAVAWSLARPAVASAAVVAVALLCFFGAVAARTAVAQAAAGAGTVLAVAASIAVLWDTGGGPLILVPFALLAVRFATLAVTRAGLRARRPVQAWAVDGAGAAVSLVAVVVAAAGAVSQEASREWTGVLALTLAGVAVAAAVSSWVLRETEVRQVAVGEAYAFAALAPLPLGDAFFSALLGPYSWVASAWSGASESARDTLSPDATWAAQPMLMPVLLLAAAAVVLAAAAHRGGWAALGTARVVGPVAIAPLPLAADLPYWAAMVFLVVLTAGLALWAAVSRTAAGGTALWTATLAVSWSLADQTATLAVLAALVLAGVLCVVRGGDSPVASAASAVTLLAVGAEGAAATLARDVPAHHAGFVVLMVAVLAVRAAAMLDARPGIARALGAGAVVLWCAAVVMTFAHPPLLSLVLATGGLTAVTGAGPARGDGARNAVLVSGWVAGAAALLIHLPVLVVAVFEPYRWAARPWTGSTGLIRTALFDLDQGAVSAAAAATAALTAVTAIASARLLGGPRAAYGAATVAVPPVLLLLPVAANVPYATGLTLVFLLAAALAARAAMSPTADLLAAGMALWLATVAVAWSFLAEVPTLAVLIGISAVAMACAVAARHEWVRAGAGAVAVLALAGLAAAAPLAAGWRAPAAAFPVLAVAAAAALSAAGIHRRRRESGIAVECSGYAVVPVAIGMSSPDVDLACASLAGAGLLVLAVALRADRRQALWPGLALLHFALWLRLGASGVDAPEAYTATVTLTGLAAGLWVRHGDGTVSSWIAYGPALAVTALPSLAVAWGDPGLTRPVLLGLAAFAVTLAGAWYRLQAPLMLGGGVLVLNAAHELGPALSELVGEGPRWLPIALTGAALLFTGATYEHRLRDLRRVRRSITGME